MEDRNDEDQSTQLAQFREIYGDMVPERIVDTKIGPDGRRYYKVQWQSSTVEARKNFLEAEMLIEKYWDPVQKKLILPSMRKENEDEAGASASSLDEDCTKEGNSPSDEDDAPEKGSDALTSNEDNLCIARVMECTQRELVPCDIALKEGSNGPDTSGVGEVIDSDEAKVGKIRHACVDLYVSCSCNGPVEIDRSAAVVAIQDAECGSDQGSSGHECSSNDQPSVPIKRRRGCSLEDCTRNHDDLPTCLCDGALYSPPAEKKVKL